VRIVTTLLSLPREAVAFVVVRAISSLGSSVTGFALNVWIYKQTGSYSIFATLAVVTALPSLIFAPIAGLVVDRFSRKWLLVFSDLAAAIVILMLALFYLFGSLTPFIVGALVVALALIRTITWPAAWASLSGLTNTEDRPRINGIAETLDGVIMISSPLLGAILFETVAIPGIACLDILSYLLCILVIAKIKFPKIASHASDASEQRRTPYRTLLNDCTFGFRWILARKDLTRLLLFFAIYNIGCSIFVVAYAPYLLSFATPSMLGTCLAFGGAGVVAGGVLFTLTGGLQRQETCILIGASISGICMIIFGASHSTHLLYAAAFFEGFSTPLTNAASQVIWQSQTPSDLQGRVFSIRKMIAWGLTPLSILVSIPLATTVFLPIIQNGNFFLSFKSIWGNGESGALGLMISACGFLCLSLSLFLLAVDGLKMQSPLLETAIDHA
jgi:MFS transporter, DHA3 family, macrolide efflux protein